MSSEPEGKISYIGVSYHDLGHMEYAELEGRINANLIPYFDGIEFMSREELERLRDSVKEARRGFRFTDTDDIAKIRIQLALGKLARLFRLVDDRIRTVSDQRTPASGNERSAAGGGSQAKV